MPEKQLPLVGVSNIVHCVLANTVFPGQNYDIIALGIGGILGW